MPCSKKVFNNCGKLESSNCTQYVGELHANTQLDICDKPSVTEVIEDINEQLDKVSESVDLTGLDGGGCMTYPLAPDGLRVVQALQAMEEKICEIADFAGLPKPGCSNCEPCSPIFNLDITCLGLDFGTLTDPCGEQPTTLKELLQLILTQLQP
jgi:hypothetical protein